MEFPREPDTLTMGDDSPWKGASRRILGVSMASHMRATLVGDALSEAVGTRGGDVTGVVFHSDRGTQGGFNWSSQHLVMEVVGDDEQASAATGDSGDEGQDVVAWAAFECAA